MKCKVIEGEWREEIVYWIIINEYGEKAYTIEDLEGILESMPFGVWISDEKDYYKYANSNVRHILKGELDIDCTAEEVFASRGINVWQGHVTSQVIERDQEVLVSG